MPRPAPAARRPEEPARTANERFKHGFSAWFWIGLFAATCVHLVIFAASPTFAVAAAERSPSAIDVLHIPEVPPPPDPDEIARPVAPVAIEDVALSEDLTIPPTMGDHFDRIDPPAPRRDAIDDGPFVTPMTRRPSLLNPDEAARALERHYPHLLRQAGIGGTVTVWFYIDEDGRVLDTRIQQSSGYEALDDAALRVAGGMRFSPAYNMDQRVAVWVAIPITFETR